MDQNACFIRTVDFTIIVLKIIIKTHSHDKQKQQHDKIINLSTEQVYIICYLLPTLLNHIFKTEQDLYYKLIISFINFLSSSPVPTLKFSSLNYFPHGAHSMPNKSNNKVTNFLKVHIYRLQTANKREHRTKRTDSKWNGDGKKERQERREVQEETLYTRTNHGYVFHKGG